jgi:aryl-alcohol dehydrogenase-like predicted oxidoreductase
LAELIQEGKVRAIGNSNFAGWQIADADWTARTRGLPRFETAQNRYSLLEREVERDVVPACLHFGLGLLTYFPLAAGLLTGKYRRGEAPPPGTRLAASAPDSPWLADSMFDRAEAVASFAREHDVSLLQVAIGGLAAMPGVATVIVGATSAEQVRANARAGTWQPSPEVRDGIRGLNSP